VLTPATAIHRGWFLPAGRQVSTKRKKGKEKFHF
jgi:hypothetical protein